MNKKNEIIGILLILISIFVFISLFSFNEFEEPSISPNIEISNRAGIIGIYISHFLIKMLFGFSSYIVQMFDRLFLNLSPFLLVFLEKF